MKNDGKRNTKWQKDEKQNTKMKQCENQRKIIYITEKYKKP